MPTVLIADDDADIRNTVRLILEDEPYTLQDAATPAAMMQVLSGAATPLIVLLDLNIQQHGQRLIEHVLADPTLRAKHVYILFTAARHDAILQAALDAHWRVLAKPFTLTDLLTALEQAAAQLPA